jgi:predicted CoA-binding protein
MYMNNIISEFLKDKSPVIVGVSSSNNAWGNELFRVFLKNDYNPIPVSRSCQEIEGVRSFASVNEIPQQELNLVLSVPSKEAEKILTSAEKGKLSLFGCFRYKPKNIMKLPKKKK